MSGVLFGATSVLCLAAALWLDRRGAFSSIDTLFNADALWYLRGFIDGRGTGTSWGPRSLVHPNLANLVHPVLALLSRVATVLGLDAGRVDMPRLLALSVCPVVAGLEVAILHRALSPLVADAALLAGIHAAAFSTALFGAVPESFAFTGLGVALLFSCLETERHTGRRQTGRLVAAAAFLASVTVTNIALFVVGVFAHRWARNDRQGLGRDILRTSVAGLAAVTAFAALSLTWQGNPGDYAPRIKQFHEAPLLGSLRSGQLTNADALGAQVGHYAGRAAIAFPEALAYTFVARLPEVVVLVRRSATDPPVSFSYERLTSSPPRIALVLALVVAACLMVWRYPHASKPLVAAALAVVGFNWCFHTFFGEELLLYSKHWSVACTVLLAGLGEWVFRGTITRRLVLVGSLVAVLGNTLYVLYSIGESIR